MTRRYSANAQPTTLSAGCTSAATTIQVTATTGFPAVDFVLALDYGAAGQELVLVTNVAGTTLTVTRGYNSTPTAAHGLGAAVRHVHTAQDFTDSRTHEAATAAVHGIAGSVVGTTDAQAVSNKDLTSGNTFPSSLATLTGAQALTNKDLTGAGNTFPATLATLAGAQVLSNKTVALGSNTVSGTKAQFDTACTDADFASLAGTETLTNKTITGLGSASNTQGDFIGGIRYITKSADQSVTSSTVYVNDNTLTMTVAANATYRVWYHLGLTQTTTGGGKIQMTLPASAALRVNPIASSGTPFAITSGNTGSNVTSTFQTVAPAVLVVAGTAGSITVQFAQDVSDPAATIMKANSYLAVERIA